MHEISSSPSHRFTLYGINLEFPVNELSVISGKTGSGKSLLLAAIIGEAELLGGSINAPSSPVAYLSQSPWLQSATIRENILFGGIYHQDRYEKVIAACALGPDLANLAKGDATSIGLRGVKLSGGQRARLAFARALYSNAQLLVLDDIFSALDSHVAKEIFQTLADSELCEGRTRILVTHHVSLCLPKAKYAVVIEENTIAYAGTDFQEVNNISLLRSEVGQISSESSLTIAQSNPVPSKTPEKKTFVKKENIFNGRLSLKVYMYYFTAAGGIKFTILYVLGLICRRLMIAISTWLLGRIKSSNPKTIVDSSEKEMDLHQYFYLYLLSSLTAVGLDIMFQLHTYSGSLRASDTLFHGMASNVVRMPLLWLDTTPMVSRRSCILEVLRMSFLRIAPK
jgi:ABC-type nitrate/sulfonate/bicarbonate transport system ATPase subunit